MPTFGLKEKRTELENNKQDGKLKPNHVHNIKGLNLLRRPRLDEKLKSTTKTNILCVCVSLPLSPTAVG